MTESSPQSISAISLKAVETEFIKKYESLPSLWDTTHEDYNNKYMRHEALQQLLEVCRKNEPEQTLYHVRQKINSLRSNYRKDLKRHLASKRVGPDGNEFFTFVPSNWKFYALRFLGGDSEVLEQQLSNSKLEEINMDEVEFDNDNDNGASDDASDEDFLAEKKKRRSVSSIDTKKHKKIKIEMECNDFMNISEMSDMELKAIGANVVCKLKRMSSDQRCQAELLINKVLYHGLKNNLTTDTDVAEVEQVRSADRC